jgi:hypothetical protein
LKHCFRHNPLSRCPARSFLSRRPPAAAAVSLHCRRVLPAALVAVPVRLLIRLHSIGGSVTSWARPAIAARPLPT